MSRPVRVLYMLHDSRRSGVPAVAANVVTSLDRALIEPSVLFAYDGIYRESLQKAGVDAQAFGKRRPLFWRLNRFLFNLRLLTVRDRVDIVHIHSTKLAVSVLFAKLLKMRVVYHLHELPRRTGWLLNAAIKAADCVVFCSKTCESHFRGASAKRTCTIVNAIEFPPGEPVLHKGIGRKIVMVGSINKNKGQDILLAAFSRMKHRDAELWLYGTTGLSAHKFVHDLKKFVAEQGLSERVFFPGPTNDVFKVFAEASVVAHTSWTESFGMALVEAMSCGVPVIAHDLEGMKEVVVDGVTGFLVKAGDVGTLSERLDALVENAELRSEMGLAAYRTVRDRFCVKDRGEQYLRLYRNVCNLPEV